MPPITRQFVNLPNGEACAAENLRVNNSITGGGIAVQRTLGDPNGVLVALVGQLALDYASGILWQNTDGATTWVMYIGGGGATVPVVNTPASFGTNQNNFAPGATTTLLRLNPTFAVDLTGLLATGVVSGHRLDVVNIGTQYTLRLVGQSSSSTAANRFALSQFGASSLFLPSDGGVSLVYDGVSARWRATGVWGLEVPYSNVGATAGTINDWNPTDGLGLSLVTRQFPNADINTGALAVITGLLSGQLGQEITFYNRNAATLTFNHDDAGSASQNRFWNPAAAAVVLAQYQTITYKYLSMNPNGARWYAVARNT